MMGGLLPVERMTDDELVIRTLNALRTGRLAGWERGFAASIAKMVNRRRAPSERQVAVMRRLVKGLRGGVPEFDGETDLVDDDDRRGAA